MDWDLAIEKNREALKRILAMLVAMVANGGNSDLRTAGRATHTLPRHLHRFVLRLLRPAEAAAWRLIIIAARGLVIEFSAPRRPKRMPKPVFIRTGFGIAQVRGRMPDRVRAAGRSVSLPLFDPLKRLGVRPRYVKPSAMPRIRSFEDPRISLFQQPREPDPLPPSPDDPLDVGRLSRRLEALASALDDLPRYAKRLVRWRAARMGRVSQDESNDTGAQGGKAGRILRFSPMRPGRPPGWRRRPDHQVYEVLTELHGLAVWARKRPDTS